MNPKIKQLLLFGVLCQGYDALAQTSLNVTSNAATIDGNVYEYSIGEMTSISTEHTSNLIVTQGFLQPHSSNSPLQTETLLTNKQNIFVYPNPTSNEIFIESDEEKEGEVFYNLYDVTGKLLISKSQLQIVGANKFKLELMAFAPGNYFLLIKKQNQEKQIENYSFKIQKTN